jgi:hypothetical protein
MKTIIWSIFLISAINFTLQAQDSRSETLFTTVYIQPEPSKAKEFREGIKSHDEKFHTQAPHQSNVFAVHNGPRTGQLVWIRGPHTYADKDLKQSESHDQDWMQNVTPNTKSFGPAETWRLEEDFSRTGSIQHDIVLVRFLDINLEDRQGYRMHGLFAQLAEAVKALEGDFSWFIYENEFSQGKQGRHFAIATDYPDWATVGKMTSRKENIMEKTFDKVHGEGAFEKFQQEWREVFVDIYDEFWIRTDL